MKMKPFTWFVLVAVAAVMATISFSQDPIPRGNAPKRPAQTRATGLSSLASKAAPEAPARTTWTPKHSFDYPAFPKGLPAGLPAQRPLEKYLVLAWNDLGMHCYQADFATFQILPPYNVFWAQVIQRGQKPIVVTQDVELRYETLNVADPARHTNFWDYAAAYGWKLEPGVGLKGKRTSGTMEAAKDHFVADGVPVVDFNDDGTWDPFPMFTVAVGDRAGQLLAQTVNVAPASTEMSCDLCHVADTLQGTMTAILKAHDKNESTDLLQRAQAGKPVQCCSCHADPAMGAMECKDCERTLSSAMHGFHFSKVSEPERKLPKNVCHACHPGPKTKCLRDVMSQSGITCTDCHGSMKTVADPARTPWTTMPSCTTCHTEDLQDPEETTIENPNEHLTKDSASLYRHSKAHGGGGIYCCACHGSPHAITPSATVRDNEQAVRLQGEEGPISKCTVCHLEEPDGEFWHFRKAE